MKEALINANYKNLEYNSATIAKLYSIIGDLDFCELTEQRIAEIQETISKYRYQFTNGSKGTKYTMTYVAERLITSSKVLGLNTPAEKAYFYLEMVDPEFNFLDIRGACTNPETKEVDTLVEIDSCHKVFGIYDRTIIDYERKFCGYALALAEQKIVREEAIQRRKLTKEKNNCAKA